MDLILSFPSGPQPENRASVRPKITGPGKQTADARKTNSTSPWSVRPSGQEKIAQRKKRGRLGNQRGKKPSGRAQRGFSSPGWLPAQAPPKKSCVRPSEKNKQGQKNKPLTQEKTNPHLFLQASVGRQTSNQIHVPLG